MFCKSSLLKLSVVSLVVCAAVVGCPQPPDYQVTLLVTPDQLDFGASETTLQFEVSKNYTSRPMSPMRLQVNQEWMVAAADKTVSEGPDDPICVSVTVDRLLMKAGENEGAVTVISEGAIHQKVKVTAKALLVSDFRTNTTFAFVGDPVEFLDESVYSPGEGPILRWLWDFGDGETSTERNPIHVYDRPGVYTVSLTVETASASVKQEKEKYITVAGKQAPEAKFELSSRDVLVDEPIRFTDLSLAGTAPITKWFWNFGDGETSTDQNPIHSYGVPGVYSVSLTVVTAHGSDTEAQQGYITVESVAPAADFVADTRTPLLGRMVQFTDRSHPGTAPINSWFWEFGDGATSTLQHPTHAYSAAGAYTVRLTVESTHGINVEEKIDYIQARLEGPSADFTASTQTPFVGDSVRFLDLSDPGTSAVTSWLWEFGDSGTSAAQNPTHVYTAPGTYSVTLIVTTPHGTDAVTKVDYIVATSKTVPAADFAVATQTPAIDDLVQFTDTSVAGTAPIVSWVWNFGDGGSSTLRNPTHAYAVAGTYTVSLTVTSEHGTDTEQKIDYISVQPRQAPTAGFVVSDQNPYATDTIQFTDTSNAGTAPITSWVWNFGDGSGGTEQNPFHAYANPGTYSVSLTVTTAHGSDSVTQIDYITVRQITAPTAEFTVSERNPQTGDALQFTDLSSSGTAPITNWLWDFGDGGTSSERHPVYTYTVAGTYTVTLTVSSAHGSDTQVQVNYIVVWEAGGPEPPTAEFTSNLRIVLVNEPVQFTDLSIPGTSEITSWLWYFGDDDTSTEQHPTHTYSALGVYDVRLTVVTDDGAGTEVKLVYITVVGTPVDPLADLDVDNADPVTGETIQFMDMSEPGTSPIVAWSWNFGDGNGSSDQNPTHTYTATPGTSTTYTVTLKVTDEDGGTDTATMTVTLWNPAATQPPLAALTAMNVVPSTGEVVQFVDGSAPGTAAITSWDWDFGDGFGSTEQHPEHAYSLSGLYTVTLTVRTAHGEDTVVRDNYIEVLGTVAPGADFFASERNVVVGQSVVFTDSSAEGTAPITSWSWNFGDGGTSTTQNPTHTYASTGSFTVWLTVTTNHGSDTETKIDYIAVSSGTEGPTANFVADVTTPFVGEPVYFTDNSDPGDGTISPWAWDFGDGQTSALQNPTNVYAAVGVYDISLTVTTGLGSDTLTRASYITVQAVAPGTAPTADFTVSNRNPQVGNAVFFTDASDPGDAPAITEWRWDFGDGVTSSQQSPSHFYATAGVYTVTLKVRAAGQGFGLETKVNHIAVSDLMAAPLNVVADNPDKVGFTHDLTDDSFDFEGQTARKQITTWTWDFGDGSTAAGQTAEHAFDDPGTYSVALTGVTAQGRISTAVRDILVHQKTALDTYVRDTSLVPVPRYEYHSDFAGAGYTAYHYKLYSQYWHAGDYFDVDDETDGLWQHWLTVVQPAVISLDTALLVIDGGSNGGGPPDMTDDELNVLALLATLMQAPMAIVSQIPNEPVEFLDEPGVSRTEDEIIAYTYDKFLDGGFEDWPLLIPMVKSAVAAMDVTQELFPAPNDIEDFVVTGASKRGWTTWLTAAVDTRVSAIAPLVIDVLNMHVSMDYHCSAYGEYSYAVQDYVDMNIFQRFGTPIADDLLDIVDPYSYIDRLTMPKYGINSTGDQFFLPDSAQFYFDDLLGEKHLRYVPNTDHSLSEEVDSVGFSLGSFFYSVATGASRPQVSWEVTGPGSMEVTASTTPTAAKLWTVTTDEGERDFRRDGVGLTTDWTSTTVSPTFPGSNVYIVDVDEPTGNRWTGYFVEFTFPGSAALEYTFTTEVRVVPEDMPYSPP